MNTISPPWAIDADDRPVDTWYEVDGNVLVQHVHHEGAAYPVVAIDAANRANNEGKCVGIRHFHYVPVASFPVIEPCKE